MRDSSLRQRGNTRRYSFADHGNSNQGTKQGKFIIKNNAAQHWNPCWGEGVTVIRPYPARSVEQGVTWDPYRFSDANGDFGDWIRRYDAVRNFGDPGVTFIIADPADPVREDPQNLPAWVLFNAIDRAVNAGQEQQGWAGLLRGGRGRSPVLSRPSEVYLLQGAIMQNKSELYNPPRGFGEDKPLVLELSMNAGVSLVTELNRKVENGSAPDGDWEHLFLNGDPVGLANGRFITFYKLADGDPRVRQQQQAGGWNTAPQTQNGQRQQEPIGFGCYLEPTFNGMPANLQQFEQQLIGKVQPWDEILWFPTVDEQAHLISDKFPPDMILYAWRDHPHWIPEAIRNRAVAQHAVNAPAGGWQQGWGAQQPGQQPGFGAPPAGGFGAPPAGGFGAPPVGQPAAGFGQPQFPAQQFPGQQPAQQPAQQFPAQQFPAQQFPAQQFPGQAPAQQFPAQPQAQQFPAQQFPGQPPAQQFPAQPPAQQFPGQPPQQPQGGFGVPAGGFGVPQPGFGGQPPQQPGQGQFPAGPTGGPPPAMGGFPPQQQYPPQQFPGQPPVDQQMAWAGQGNAAVQPGGMPQAGGVPAAGMMPPGMTQPQQMPTQMGQPANPMGQTPNGFAQQPQGGFGAPPAGNYQQPGFQQPQQGGFQAPQQGVPPQMQQPQGGQPLSRAAAALQAAQQAAQQG